MVKKVGPEDLDVTLKFGGGLHTRASEDEIDPREAADGGNFLLDLENRELRNRPPFDLVGTVPNAAEIRGGVSLVKSDGSVSMLIQAGSTVYQWDGVSFTSRGTVGSTAKLRSHWRTHNWQLDDVALITDLNLIEPVMKWDGSTLSDVLFTDENGGTFGNFHAKYCVVSNERAIFGHCKDATTNKHMIVGAKRGDFTVITIANRPASALSEEDPFFLLTPDLRSINGLVEAFGTFILSTEKGALFNLAGQSAKDFSFEDFYPGSAASGEESLTYIGTDVIYGRQGRIESVRDTDRFGDSEADDLTARISDVVAGYTGWRVVYNSRLNRVYLFPSGQSEVWVFQTAMLDGDVSPWMRWTTSHSMAFQPTFAMSMIDPLDGLEYVFMGDSSGNLYRLEGSGAEGDAGANAIETTFLTKLISAPLTAQFYNIEGYIKYRKNQAATIEITFEYAGEAIFSHPLTINIPAIEGLLYYGGEHYFSDGEYYGALTGKLSRQPLFSAGQANEFQVRIRCQSNVDININEIGLRFSAASS